MAPVGAGRVLLYIGLFMSADLVTWVSKGVCVPGGDDREYLNDKIYGNPVVIYHVREPGAVSVWQATAWAMHAWSGPWAHREGIRRLQTLLTRIPGALEADASWFSRERSEGTLDPPARMLAFALVGSLSAGLFAVFAAAFMGQLGPIRAPRGLAAAVALASGATVLVFINHAEFYAPLYAALALFYWRAAAYFRARTLVNFSLLIASALIAVTMHRVAVFHMPALIVIFRADAPNRLRLPDHFEATVILLAVIAAAMAHIVPITLASLDIWKIYVIEDYNWLPELITPIGDGWAGYVANHSKLGATPLFTLGSLEHWKHFLFFLAISSPVALLFLVFGLRRPRSDLERFLIIGAACAWVWAFLWHPHKGYADWDLFCNGAVPLNFLAAAVILREKKFALLAEDHLDAVELDDDMRFLNRFNQ